MTRQTRRQPKRTKKKLANNRSPKQQETTTLLETGAFFCASKTLVRACYYSYMKIAGIDEVGRGAWAGPLCVAVVVLDDERSYPYCDSKTLTIEKREAFSADILACAPFVHIEMVRPQLVDELGLGGAMKHAMRGCIEAGLEHADRIVVDGIVDYAKDYDVPSEAVIKADNHVPAVSAASIVAKVHRDAYMRILAKRYPAYSLTTNVGYGTKQHRLALGRDGTQWFHRHSYKPIQLIRAHLSGNETKTFPQRL